MDSQEVLSVIQNEMHFISKTRQHIYLSPVKHAQVYMGNN